MPRGTDRSGDLAFSINLESTVSVYMQIENQVQFAVSSGTLKGGDVLPSVRDLAVSLGVNPNTVAKAYRDMELIGLVYARRGVGYTVVEKGVEACRSRTLLAVEAHLREAVSECMASGMAAGKLKNIVADAVTERKRPYQ